MHCPVSPWKQAEGHVSRLYRVLKAPSVCRHELRRHAVPENALDGGIPDQGCSAGQDTGARGWARYKILASLPADITVRAAKITM